MARQCRSRSKESSVLRYGRRADGALGWTCPFYLCRWTVLRVSTLDRNGLRPCRFYVTDDDRIICALRSRNYPGSVR
ncbi:hypothetical protein FN846DRAFT_397803 [Sphaerosporella brunnea]|uniref:Glutamine amidotransferase type-2 domain-containing protein n=1 Tax=Sphaerosporella brunnea TaxID=1250544 RepID=A0A5J5F5B9_9PEZI|nr:hypothetical protein FN846DRAFT_397803 [Sphaerosporella brunnea]